MRELIKARIDELQSDIDRVKSNLSTLKESATGNLQAEDVQKLSSLKDELLTFKAGQAELINILQAGL